MLWGLVCPFRPYMFYALSCQKKSFDFTYPRHLSSLFSPSLLLDTKIAIESESSKNVRKPDTRAGCVHLGPIPQGSDGLMWRLFRMQRWTYEMRFAARLSISIRAGELGNVPLVAEVHCADSLPPQALTAVFDQAPDAVIMTPGLSTSYECDIWLSHGIQTTNRTTFGTGFARTCPFIPLRVWHVSCFLHMRQLRRYTPCPTLVVRVCRSDLMMLLEHSVIRCIGES